MSGFVGFLAFLLDFFFEKGLVLLVIILIVVGCVFLLVMGRSSPPRN